MTATWHVAQNNGLVASGGVNDLISVPVKPPKQWFDQLKLGGPTPVEFTEDGQVFGHVAAWGTTHIGFMNKDVHVPRTACGYAKFATGTVLCEGGETVATGRLFTDTVHPSLKKNAADTIGHYDHSGCAVADVSIYEDEWGILVCGAQRPTLTEGQLRVARGSDWSGDWRSFNKNLELVAVLGVNQGGFIVDGLVASGGAQDDGYTPVANFRLNQGSPEPLALVASGMISRTGETSNREMALVRETVAKLEREVLELKAANLKSKFS